MTIAGWPVLLGAIVVNADNRAIRLTEGGVTETVNLVAGTYYLRGDGSSGDFCAALDTALTSHSGGGSYVVALAVDESAGQRTMRLTITSSATFSILWNDNATTFDQALIGFADAATASATSCTSTLSPSSSWASDEVYESFEPMRSRATFSNPTKSGKRKGGERSVTLVGRVLSLAMVAEDRMNQDAIPADAARALDHFVDYVGASLDFEVHLVDLSAGLVSAPLSTSTRFSPVGQGSTWRFDEETASAFVPSRMEPGLALYDKELRMWAVPA